MVFLESLSEVLVWGGLFILATLAYYLTKAGFYPLQKLAEAIPSLPGAPDLGADVRRWTREAENALVGALDDVRRASDAGLARALNLLADSLALGVGLAALVALGAKAALEYLWHHLVKPVVVFVDALPHRIATAGTAMYHAVYGVARDVVHAFERDVVKPLERSVATVSHDLYRTVKPIAEHALADVTALGKTVYRDVLPVLRHTAADVTKFGGWFADATAAVAAEIPRLPSLGYDEIDRLLGKVPWNKIAGLLTFGVLARWAIRALARETGLEKAECRGKVKGICGTNPRAWESLLQLALDFTVLTNICDVLPLLEEGFSVVGAPLVGTLTDASAGLCHGTLGPPDRLHPPALHLPPVEGVHLHLAA